MVGIQRATQARSDLGAHWDGQGVSFCVYSKFAISVQLCLFASDGVTEIQRLPMQSQANNCWVLYIDGIKPGALYGYRMDGTYSPAIGQRFNVNKVLLDPYARAIKGQLHWVAELYAYDIDNPTSMNAADNAALVPKSVVIDPDFDWEDDRAPNIPWSDTIIYEMHVKGFTQLNALLPAAQRGTYLGLANKVIIDYLCALGITSVELLPVTQSMSNNRLYKLGLQNYWGYDPIAPFAPDNRFAIEDSVQEFKQMVKALHKAGIEVILDVVYNHTGETDELGPSLSFRGIDNTSYYALDAQANYINITGCGNTFNVAEPQTLQLLIDCLRYWVEDMHVDGFRFDLATTIAREHGHFNPAAAFFAAIKKDPVLANVKLIAEPWDLGEGGYRLGQFPADWREWNDRYRDTVRAYWRGDEAQLPALADCICGSEDIFRNKQAQASLNFITSHDGFTLRDLVCYVDKHNHANGENNRDGHNHNLSANYGEEGPSQDNVINALRLRQQKNMLTTLLFSQGVPMLLAGDEIGRSQQGNNNAYCQDNEINWLDWQLDKQQAELLTFTRVLFAIRREFAAFKYQAFMSDNDIAWLRPDGEPMGASDWQKPFARCITIVLRPPAELMTGHRNEVLVLILNASEVEIDCRLPAADIGLTWQCLLDTSRSIAEFFDVSSVSGDAVNIEGICNRPGDRALCSPGEYYTMPARSSALFMVCNGKL